MDGKRAEWLELDLVLRREHLGEPGLEAWQAWNLGRESARDALESADLRAP